MRRFLIIVVFVFGGVIPNVFAQGSFGFQSGYINSFTTGELGTTGFNLGPILEQALSPNLDFQLGAFYSCVSRKWQAGSSDLPGFTMGTNTYTGHFIGVPLWLKINFSENSDDMRLFVFGGPRVNFGFSQRVVNRIEVSKTEITTQRYSVYDLDLDKDQVKDFAHYELLAGVGFGIQYQTVQGKIGYDWGLKDLNNTGSVVLKRNQLTASLAFIFQ